MPINQIGQYFFTAMQGPPDALKNSVRILRRPGVAGAAVWNMGQMSAPFQIRTGLDTTTFNWARTYFALYAQLIGAGPQSFVWSNYDLSSEGFAVVVENVIAVPGRTIGILGGVGGLSPPSTGWVEVDWTLVPIPLSQT